MKTRLIVTIDTECDKRSDWRCRHPLGFSGIEIGVANCLQPVFNDHGIRPVYFISPEVLCHRDSCDLLRSLKNVELASHLHGDFLLPEIETWDVGRSVADDLQFEYSPLLERNKMRVLTELFTQQFDRRPFSFRAGRFGVGVHSGKILQELGYRVDSSVTPHIAWTDRSGNKLPDFRGAPEYPYFVSENGNLWKQGKSTLLEVPVTVLPTGSVPANNPGEPIWLRPWYSDATTLCRVVDRVLAQPAQGGIFRPLVMMFHNVEVIAGGSPYPQTESEVQRFLDQLRTVFDYAAKRGIEACTLEEYYNKITLSSRFQSPKITESILVETQSGIPSTSTRTPSMGKGLLLNQRSIDKTVDRRQASNLESFPRIQILKAPASNQHRPRVMLMADVPNWIFARHCKVLMERLGSQFDFDLKLQGQPYNEADYDLIYPLEWNLIPQNQIRTPAKYVTSIRSHTSWAGQDFLGFTQFLNTHFQRIHTVSERLTRVFKPFVPQTDYVTHGTDTTFFTPTRPVDQTPLGRVRVGWAGNRVNKTKGFEELIAPLGKLPGVELVFCGYMDKNLDLEGMRRFYDSIDVYICSSGQEGNNNSLLEAASMERSILTTDNGTVPEYLQHRHSALIVERELPLLIQAVCELRDHPELRRSLGIQARQSVIARFDWNQMAPKYAEFFQKALDGVGTRQPRMNASQGVSEVRTQPLAIEVNPGRTGGAVRYAGGWSFLIITNGKRPRKLLSEIESIRSLRIPEFEILVGGEPPADLPEGVETVLAIDAARNGRLGEMRNALTAAAKYDRLVIVDDDFLFHKDFYTGLQRYGDDWEALSVRILNPDGSRFWDWATHGGPRGHVLLDYDECDEYVYITGGLILLKADVAYRVKWDDIRGFYQGEDIDFSKRLKKSGVRLGFNRYSTTTHDDGRYMMEVELKEYRVNRRSMEIGLPVRWVAPIFNPSGYASEAINFVLPLKNRCELGVYHHNKIYSESFVQGLVESEREVLFGMRDRFNEIKGGIFVSHNPAGGFVRLSDADYSIGRSMFETDRIPADWVTACNRMDEVWVPSQFNVETFAKSGVERFKLVVMPGAVDSEFFDPARHTVYPLPNPARFNFLSIFEWSSRKGWDVLLAAYSREFSADDDVCLWLRTYLFSKPDGDPTEAIWLRIQEFTASLGLDGKKLPRIELIAEQVPSDQLPGLYLACDCYVAPSRGEGWGRPQHEAMLMERPVIATNWSANTEFMTVDNSYLLDYEVVDTQGLEPELSHYKGHRWANPSESHLRTLMRHVFTHTEEARLKGQTARKHMAWNYNREAVADRVIYRLQHIERSLKQYRLAPALITDIHGSRSVEDDSLTTLAIDGSFFDLGSLSSVNRALLQALDAEPSIRAGGVSRAAAPTGTALPLEVQSVMRRVFRNAPLTTEITVRHEWPPRWDKPQRGAWVLIQPWEFGSIPAEWAVQLRDVDEIWCPSRYVRSLYLQAGIPTEKLKVLPNGYNPLVHHPNAAPTPIATRKRFKFLFVGGTIARKGADLLLATFLKTFRRSDDVCLVIKDFGGKSAYQGQTLAERIRSAQADTEAPEIVYLDQDLPEQELAGLYTSCDCLVHPYRGEGFGLPVLEAMACALPVICTGGGATDDFATDEFVHRLPSRRAFIGNSVSGMKLDHRGWWLEPDLEELSGVMREVVLNPQPFKERAKLGAQHVLGNWTWAHSARTMAVLASDLKKRLTKAG